MTIRVKMVESNNKVVMIHNKTPVVDLEVDLKKLRLLLNNSKKSRQEEKRGPVDLLMHVSKHFIIILINYLKHLLAA